MLLLLLFLKKHFNNAECVISKTNDHCAILYGTKIYDANGIRHDVKNFKIANGNDIEYMENYFGLNIKNLEASNLIKEINNCNIKIKLKR